MGKKFLIIVPLVVIAAISYWVWNQSKINSGYYGLPVVACVDPTRPVVQNFSFNLEITINGTDIPLSPDIGHDPGKCLRSIHTVDSSGKVLITSNNAITYNLKDFFNVWHKNFSSIELMGYIVGNGHKIYVYVNGKAVGTADQTPIRPSDSIQVVYR